MTDSFDKSYESELNSRKMTPLETLIKILNTDEQVKDQFQYNLFTHQHEHAQDSIILSSRAKKGNLINDEDFTALRCYIAKKYGISAHRTNLEDAVYDVSMMKQYNPIKNFLEGTVWDGQPRLDLWLNKVCGAPDNAYTRAVGRKMLTAAVKRVYEPGCYYAQLVILEGPQRLYKSRLVKEIGREWYASIHLKTKDTKAIVEEMRGKWILEIEELAGFSKQETEYMKAFISRQVDRVRLSYDKNAGDYLRKSIMIATMNPEKGDNKYLVDQTGNVRYWPIQCDPDKKIDIDLFIKLRSQLFAEAYVLYKQNEALWLISEEEENLAWAEQDSRLSSDPWSVKIEKYLIGKNEQVTTFDIAELQLNIPIERIHSGTTRRIGRILTDLGWIRHRETKGSRKWYYTPPGSEPKETIEWDE